MFRSCKPRAPAVSLVHLDLANRIALLLSIIATLAAFLVADDIFEHLPHLEDEMAYLWQARVFAKGQIAIPSPAHANSFFVPFVVDYEGLRFGKYPPGWPAILAVGVLTGMSNWINPLLAGLGVWLTFRLGQKIFDNRTALLAAGLLITSPFFLINSGSLLSHPFSLFLSLTLAISWVDLFFGNAASSSPSLYPKREPSPVPAWIKTCAAGFSLGGLAITRPLTAIGIGLPFFVHGLVLLWRGNWIIRKQVLTIGLIAGTSASLLFLWQFILTGNPMLNPYTLWWKYDRVGFGEEFGRQVGGHNLFWGMGNLLKSLESGSYDLFGWGGFSWLFLPSGLWAVRHKQHVKLLIGVIAGQVLCYTTYWISPNRFGPRYYYEFTFILCLLSAAGIFWLADYYKHGPIRRLFQAGTTILVIFLVGYNLIIYLPERLNQLRNLYGVNRAQQASFLTEEAQALTPALVIVHPRKWTDYGGLLVLEDPWLTSPFIFAYDPGPVIINSILEDYPNRNVFHYYPATKTWCPSPPEKNPGGC